MASQPAGADGKLTRCRRGSAARHWFAIPALSVAAAGRPKWLICLMPVVTDAIMFCDVPSAAGAIRGGTVRALGVTTKARLPGFPDIAPIADALPGFEGAAWLMIAAPAKTPEPVVAKLHGEINAILASPPVREQMAKIT